jgi:hypothetical protein
MGADMTLHCAPACDLTPERIRRLEQVIRAIPDDDPDFCELMETLGYDDPEYAKGCIIEKCQESQYESRDVTTLSLPGCPYNVQVSGGLSWGDVPTESYAVLEHVECCTQAWQIMEEFAREDYQAARSPKPD